MDWFEGRRHWAQLLELVSMLPEHSRYKAKMLGDEGLAEKLLEVFGDNDSDAAEPSLVAYDPVVQKLDQVLDSLSVLVSATLAPHLGAKTPKPRQVPRPRTGLQKVRSRLRLAKHNEILSDFGFNKT